ncbi:MAG: glycosyltransferase family 39 protein [Ignavibacteriales bacterium]|nr:glycosyltransferase family 39 protein [Ignavibacteriales bacterium]
MITTWKSLVPWERWFLLFLLFLTLGLRFGYVAEMSQTSFLTQLRLDELYHNNWAKSIAAGNIIGDQIYFRAPLYAYLLGLCFALFGHSYIIPRIFQHFLGTLSVLLVYFLARRLFGKKVAVLSSILMATYAAVIYNENKFLLESILLPQAVLFFLLLYSVKEKPTFWKWFWLGILFGLICITRPIFLPFLLILALIIFFWYRKIFPFNKYLSWLCGIFLGTMIIIAPVTLRNYIVGGDFVLIASQGGINFYIGNNPSADGFSSTMPGSIGNRWNNRDIVYPIQQSTGRYPKISEIDGYWQKQAFNFIIKHPYEFILLTIKKLYLFWNNIEIPNNGSFYLYSQFSKILTWLPTGFWIVSPLGLLGMWIGWNEKRYRTITIFIIYYTAFAILFFVCDRFRLPIVPFLCIFAGLSIIKLWDHLKKQANKTIGKYIAVLFLFGLIVNSNLYNLQKGNRASDLFHLGNMELSAGNYTRAISYYEQIPKTKYLIQDVYLNWGVAEMRLGRIENAVKQFQHELEIFPESYDALANLTRIYSMTGAHEKTIQYARQAIQMKPLY